LASNQPAKVIEASQIAGVQLNLSREQAQSATTQAREDNERSVQREARAEGGFAGHERPEDESAESQPAPTEKRRLNKVA
jgi:hypothetical protein